MNAFTIFRGKATLIIVVFVIMIGAKLVTPEFSTLILEGLTFDGTGNSYPPPQTLQLSLLGLSE